MRSHPPRNPGLVALAPELVATDEVLQRAASMIRDFGAAEPEGTPGPKVPNGCVLYMALIMLDQQVSQQKVARAVGVDRRTIRGWYR